MLSVYKSCAARWSCRPGSKAQVLAGMWALIDRFKLLLIIETGSVPLGDKLKADGYAVDRAPGSSNVLFRPL